jgi:ribosomal protein L16 Arg81 hydroxylase
MTAAVLDVPPPSTMAAAPAKSLLTLDPADFAASFNRRPFLIGHRLSEHPLFDLDRLLRLAQVLPEKHIEYNAGQLPVNQDQALTPRNGLSPAETIRRIRECQSWMVLKNVEHDLNYRALLEQCLDEVRPHTEPIARGMCLPHAFIFLTSPGSVTPYHMDPEHNFLLQVRGGKTVRLFDGNDPTILSTEELETFYSRRVRNMTLKEENRERCWTYDLQPGQGLHFPVTFPHWVQNGSEVSISFSITFRTPDLDRRRMVHQFNHALRRCGVQPAACGLHPERDNVKYQLVRGWSRLCDAFRRDD